MVDLQTDIKELQLAAQTLLKSYVNLKKENLQLKKMKEELEASVLEKERLLEETRQKLAAGQVNELYDASEKKMLQEKIDMYLKDVEKCLDLLNASTWKS